MAVYSKALDILRAALSRNFALTIFLIGLVPLAAFSALSLVFPHSREIVHDLHTVLNFCPPPGAKRGPQCVGRVELIIGNTGSAEESVHVAWPQLDGPWRGDHDVINISADQPRDRDPEIDCTIAGGRQECTIDHFAPGALVFLRLDCYGCSAGAIERAGETPLEFQTGAHLTYGDPRVTILFRRLLALVRFFI